MAVSATNAPLSGLSRRLVQDGLIAEDAVIHAIKGAEAQHIGLVAYLVDRQLVEASPRSPSPLPPSSACRCLTSMPSTWTWRRSSP